MISLKKVKQKICPVARKEMIVDAALEIMAKQGVSALTMDKVVAQLPCSKGTVYNHFSCKEDLLIGIGDKAIAILIKLFNRAIAFEGNSREKVLSIHLSYLIYAILHNDLFQSVVAIKSPTVYNKASSKHLASHEALEMKLMAIFHNLIESALADNELINANNLNSQQISFSLWSMNFGTIALLGEDVMCCEGRKGLEVEREYFNHNNILLDGLGWLPLQADFDYRQTARKVLSTIFKDEVALIAQRGRVLMF